MFQLASAMENLKHIFTAPEIVRKTEELINEGKLLQAHKQYVHYCTSRVIPLICLTCLHGLAEKNSFVLSHVLIEKKIKIHEKQI